MPDRLPPHHMQQHHHYNPPSNYHPMHHRHSQQPIIVGNGMQDSRPEQNGHSQPSSAVRASKEKMDALMAQLATANENTWMLIGAVSEQMQDQDKALSAFEHALRHNPMSILGLNAVASIARSRDDFNKAIEYFQRILNIKQDNGEVWGSMGHCLLMKDDLPKAYTAYQQALYHLPNPKEPKLWYGIGILYDRYGSFEHAEEAFSSVLKMDPNFEKANEIYFRLGIIYKHQKKYGNSLDCFRYILNNPPRPLTAWDIWFQLGHVHEQDRDYNAARDAYNRVLQHQPDHAKVLQQLGWLYHQPGASFANQDMSVSYLTKSLETDGTDAQSWYLLGRAFMAGQRYNKAYEAYQQAVYRDGRNPTFWCSIGVLYYQINQYRDALDAYSRAIRLNPYISEVWFNLGSLYESCNNQITDAIDAYSRAAELDPGNREIKLRLAALQQAQSGVPPGPAPAPIDVHPSQYSATPQGANYQPESPRHPAEGRDLPPPPPGEYNRSPGPFRGGGAPPPLNHVDESRGSMGQHAPLAPIEEGRQREANRYDPMARSPSPRRGYPPHPNFPQQDYRHRASPRMAPRQEYYQPQPSYDHKAHPDMRAPSPAQSSSSKNGKRKSEKQRPKEEKKKPKRSVSPRAQNRSIDENYDEGAADALMFLHGDTTHKRPSPPSPTTSHTAKKSRSGESSSTQTTIEVLNAPRPEPQPVHEKEAIPNGATENGDVAMSAEPVVADKENGDIHVEVVQKVDGEVEKVVEPESQNGEVEMATEPAPIPPADETSTPTPPAPQPESAITDTATGEVQPPTKSTAVSPVKKDQFPSAGQPASPAIPPPDAGKADGIAENGVEPLAGEKEKVVEDVVMDEGEVTK